MARRAVTLGMLFILSTAVARADIIGTGSFYPTNPATWDERTYANIGPGIFAGSGTIAVDDGSELLTRFARLGTWSQVTGTVTVTGPGSTWNNVTDLYVGDGGNGNLRIADGGMVHVGEDTYVALQVGSTGVIELDNGTLTTHTLLAPVNTLTGTGTINANSWFTDAELVFDSSHGIVQTIVLNGPGKNVNVNLSVDGSAAIGAGYFGQSPIRISDGVRVESTYGYLGYRPGSMGTATVTGAGSTWVNSSDLYVGNSGVGVLDITSGASVSNAFAYIGNQSGSTGTVTISGAGSTWTNSSGLFVGDFGDGLLDISVGASVVCSSSNVGAQVGRSGSVMVTGDGSTWTNTSYIRVGEFGDGSVFIADGAYVSSAYASIGVFDGSTGAMTVTGAGSAWTNDDTMYIGDDGAGTLGITHGATVTSNDGYIGYETGSTGAVTISGPGSTWICSGSSYNPSNLNVGYRGDATLDITDGGHVSSMNAYIGYGGAANSSTGVVTVSGPESTWTNSNALFVGYYNEGTLNISDGAHVSNIFAIGYKAGSHGAVTVGDAGSTATNYGDLNVGYDGDGTLRICDSGLVEVYQYTFVARYAGSTGAIDFDGGTLISQALFAGAGSLTGSGTINAKGLVSNVDLAFDAMHGATQTLALSGPGQAVTINLSVDGSAPLGAGYAGDASVIITDGRTVISSIGYLGYQAGSTGAATVSGANSVWTNSDEVYVGYHGDGTLDIVDAANVSNKVGHVGEVAGSSGAVTVRGAGSTWANSGDLFVGYAGEGTLTVDQGAAVANAFGFVGYSAGSTGTVTVTGDGSTWTASGKSSTMPSPKPRPGEPAPVGGELSIGYRGGGTLRIYDGAHVDSGLVNLGHKADSTGMVTISGASSQWTSSGTFCVGNQGAGTLDITDGASVSNTDGYIAYYSSDSNGDVTVSGPGSTWASSGSLYVGYRGQGSVDVGDRGLVRVDGDLHIADLGTGTVNVNAAGTLAVAGLVNVDSGGTLDVDGMMAADSIELAGGTMRSRDAGVVGVRELTVSAGEFDASQPITIAGQLAIGGEPVIRVSDAILGVKGADLLNNPDRELTFQGGTVAIDAGTAAIAMSGTDLIVVGDTVLDLGASTAATFDELIFGAGSTLTIQSQNPVDLTFRSVGGEGGLDAGTANLTILLPGETTRTLTLEVPGTTDAVADYVAMLDHLGQTVDASDISIVTFDGYSYPVISSVPEPSTLCLLISAGLLAVAFRRKRGSQ